MELLWDALMIYLIGLFSRGTSAIHSGQVEDSISSGSLHGLQEKEKLRVRVRHRKHLHATFHPARAAAETELLSRAQAFKFMVMSA